MERTINLGDASPSARMALSKPLPERRQSFGIGLALGVGRKLNIARDIVRDIKHA